ncbi:hypothetical protein ABZ330_02860 [Streptomyces sp. NPDC006172]|uniref:hypothetical protein n=1 Tax=Streptomyces sp. NPDC006172 TaxID=3154470 RepID=UPI0033DB20D2
MRAQRVRRLAVTSAAGLLLAGGIAVGTAGTASASTASLDRNHSRCYDGSWWYGNCYRGGFPGNVSGFYGVNPFFANAFNPYNPFFGNLYFDNFGGFRG